MLSVSPLIIRPQFDAQNLQTHKEITEQKRIQELKKKKQIKEIPNRIEDLSPSPIPMKRPKSPMLYKYDKFGYK